MNSTIRVTASVDTMEVAVEDGMLFASSPRANVFISMTVAEAQAFRDKLSAALAETEVQVTA